MEHRFDHFPIFKFYVDYDSQVVIIKNTIVQKKKGVPMVQAYDYATIGVGI